MFERVWTVQLPNGQGPDAISFETKLPGGDPRLAVEAWGAAGALLLSGKIDLPEAQGRVTAKGTVDVLQVVPASGLAWRRWAGEGWLTVFFPTANASGAPQFVTVKVRQV